MNLSQKVTAHESKLLPIEINYTIEIFNFYFNFAYTKSNKTILNIKVTAKAVPQFNKAPHHENVWGNGDIAPLILSLSTRCRGVVGFTPRNLYRRGKSPSTHQICGLVGLRRGLDAWRREKSLKSARNRISTPVT
jgi:hypothetical protein